MEQRCPNCFHAGATDPCPACGWTAESNTEPDALAPGTKLGDARRTGGVLRRTARGFVYRGWDERLDLDLAVEEYFPQGLAARREDGSVGTALDASGSESFAAGRERFLDEGRRLMQIGAAPGLAPVADVVQQAGTAYRVSRLLDGIWLEAFLARREGGVTREPALRILRPVLDALEAAHGAGVTHGAVSAGAVMLCRSGEVKLLDFTGDGSPEDDVRGAAALFYRLMTGASPPADGPLDAEGLDGLERHERLALEGALRGPAGQASARAFREALDAPAPPQPQPVPAPTPQPAAKAPPPEPEDPDKTRILIHPDPAAKPDHDPLRTRILEPPPPPPKPAAPAPVARDQTPSVILPQPKPAQIPQPTRKPPLSPLFVAAAALLGLLVLVLLAWLPYRYFTAPTVEPEAPQEQAQSEEQAEVSPAPAPGPDESPEPDEPPPPTPAPAPEPEARVAPDSRSSYPAVAPTPRPAPPATPQPARQPAPQPASVGLDSALVGAWSARMFSNGKPYDCMLRIEGPGDYFMSAGCPGRWAREQGRLEASGGAWRMLGPTGVLRQGSYSVTPAGLRWIGDTGFDLQWTRG
ncbi:MAG: hypothetical protein KDC27_12060, partial [Acidobacteria bacterium]|nr:hypothetical protein [Acidobacteriota bacterium]